MRRGEKPLSPAAAVLLPAGLAALLVALVATPASSEPAMSSATASETIVTPGLARPVAILVDRWGVPHLYAQGQDDLFFAQGWNAARDRLWQLDLWKRRGEGLLSDAFGPRFVEQDRAARLLVYRGHLYREWLAYAEDTKRIVTAFVAGINAYIALTEREPERLPVEFRLLGYRPARWSPETVVRLRSHGLLRNVESEVRRARLLRDHGPAALALADRLEPAHAFVIPEGLDLQGIPDDVLEVYALGTAGVTLEPEDLRRLASPVAASAVTLLAPAGRGEGLGSNNWALAPSRTTTGRPILANDPHRALAVPSLRYLVHLSAPGFDAVGAGEPALPGISIGHNGQIAFGLTIFAIDQEDLYVYRTNPAAADEYEYRGRFEPMRTVQERIPVRGAPDVEVTLKFTRHGPVLFEDALRGRAFALRAAWLEPGGAPYLASLAYMRARDWHGFLAAMNRWGLPSENQVFADTAGHIGWKPGGFAPVRPNWDGLLPVPGDGRYEWDGLRDMDELPVGFDPPEGFVATANQMNLPVGYPHGLGYEWSLPYRYERLREVLGGTARLDLRDSLALQADVVSLPARRLKALLAGLPSRPDVDLLRAWDGSLGTASAGAALFEVWLTRHLRPAVVARVLPTEAARKAVGDGDVEQVL
jgi:penicillin amidase